MPKRNACGSGKQDGAVDTRQVDTTLRGNQELAEPLEVQKVGDAVSEAQLANGCTMGDLEGVERRRTQSMERRRENVIGQ